MISLSWANLFIVDLSGFLFFYFTASQTTSLQFSGEWIPRLWVVPFKRYIIIIINTGRYAQRYVLNFT
jgi:hypothetical protein